MPSKSLKVVWGFLSFALLAAGAFMIATSIVWRDHDPVRNFIISDMDLDAGLGLGIAFLITWMMSIGGILQQNHVVIGLVITNWALILDALGVIAIGGTIWFYTLTPTLNYLDQWQLAHPATRQALQDTLSCCGYRNSTELGVVGGFCENVTFAAAQVGCSTDILSIADYTLNNVFTVIFGFMAVLITFFLATVCVVYRRLESERFRKIDEKRGGRGFV